MKGILKILFSALSSFFGNKVKRRCFYLVLLILAALGEFLLSGLARRTFVFYSYIEDQMVVEDRLLRRSASRETDINRYIEEALLGPQSPGSALLFPRETRLHSFMFRGGVVYADLSEDAVVLLTEGGNLLRSLLTLNQGIRRNFPYVRDVRLFIGGNEVFFEEFHGIFVNSADNSKTSP